MADLTELPTEVERLRNDLALAQFAGEAGQMHLGALVDQLRGERGVMLELLRELLTVVETIEPDCDHEAFKLWALRAQTTRLLLWADNGATACAAAVGLHLPAP